jgi:DNA repair photolyase
MYNRHDRFKLTEVNSSSIITKSNLPDAEYVINPYVGCMHACAYCYAVFMRRFTDHKEPWGRFVDVKVNAPDLIPQGPEAVAQYQGKTIFLSSVTDPYQPFERRYRVTRRTIERLIPLQPKLSILTKSDLVLRDIDLLKQFRECEVGFSIAMLDDHLRREIEPCAAPIPRRIDALRKLRAAGIKTYAFIGPILPGLTDWREIIRKTRGFVDFYMFENLNVRGSIWGSVQHWLCEKHPELLDQYRAIYMSPNDYWERVEADIESWCRTEGVACRIYFHH